MKVTQTIDMTIVCSVCGKDVKITQVDIDEAYVEPCDCITLEVERITTTRIEHKIKASVGLLSITLDDYTEEESNDPS